LPYGYSYEVNGFDIRTFWRSALSVRVPECQKRQRFNPAWHRTLYSCTLVARIGGKDRRREGRERYENKRVGGEYPPKGNPGYRTAVC